ncbi:hypothetical protein D3C75_1073600 [compost metagenome]
MARVEKMVHAILVLDHRAGVRIPVWSAFITVRQNLSVILKIKSISGGQQIP